MSASPVSPSAIATRVAINHRAVNGSSVTYIEVPDDNYAQRYDVQLDGQHLCTLVVCRAPLTGEMICLSSRDDSSWWPAASTPAGAAQFALPLKPVC